MLILIITVHNPIHTSLPFRSLDSVYTMMYKTQLIHHLQVAMHIVVCIIYYLPCNKSLFAFGGFINHFLCLLLLFIFLGRSRLRFGCWLFIFWFGYLLCSFLVNWLWGRWGGLFLRLRFRISAFLRHRVIINYCIIL